MEITLNTGKTSFDGNARHTKKPTTAERNVNHLKCPLDTAKMKTQYEDAKVTP